MIKSFMYVLLHPLKAYRAFCASCDALEETTYWIEKNGKFDV